MVGFFDGEKMQLIFRENISQNVLIGEEFSKRIEFPKVHNINRIKPEHKQLNFRATEKIDGQNIAIQKVADELLFYSRNQILERQGLGKQLNEKIDNFNWHKVYDALAEKEVIYVEFYGNHNEFDYLSYGRSGFMIFARRLANGSLTHDVRDIAEKSLIPVVPLIMEGKLPHVDELREMLERPNTEGYVFSAVTPQGEYITYKAKRRELSEEAIDEERATILASDEKPQVKIAKIVVPIARFKHIWQKFIDLGKDHGSNDIIPELVKAVVKDVWDESSQTIEELGLSVQKRAIDKAVEERVKVLYFDYTLKESLG